jgi:capsular polysaccharide biosynthesis protein
MAWLSGIGDDLPHRLSAFEDFEDADDRPAADPATGLVSLGFIAAALRRGMRIWCALALVGLIAGAGWYAKSPPTYKATASVLLADSPNSDPAIQVLTDQTLAESTPVAAAVVRQLGLTQTPTSFAETYTITVVTDQVLAITAQASSSQAAVQRAAAVAKQFLAFRAQYEQTQQQETDAQLEQQVTQAQQRLASVTSQISRLSSQPSTSATAAELTSLKAQKTAATTALAQVRQYVTQTLASTQTVARGLVQGSEVLNTATLVKHSSLKTTLLYAIIGLFGGLAVGMVIVIIVAITSDRLRRRDDIAYAFGAPVRLSVGRLRKSRWIPGLPRQGATRRRDMELVVENLRNAVPGSSRGPAGLAVVAVDDTPTVARAVVTLAASIARQSRHVVLADLSAGAHAAHLLKVKGPGVTPVTTGGVRTVVVVPAADDVAPVGPLRSRTSPDGYVQADQSLAAACADADLVLSLVTLNPAFGGEYVASWATDAVAVVTAGRSTAVRIHAAGELIRLAGMRLGSVVVLDADKSDESLGMVNEPGYQAAPRLKTAPGTECQGRSFSAVASGSAALSRCDMIVTDRGQGIASSASSNAIDTSSLGSCGRSMRYDTSAGSVSAWNPCAQPAGT